ncbi:hypothetical protein M092_3017 [Parabacteroides distasonis str. 3776 D15 iv]|uniref:Uncharacterized protein n=1 Tax=Parabacteroides distasonis str. 3776 D15 i TaxID=1339342 RepID=A0AB34L7Z9_PARDI|nr:hypothetical protein HMPREF0103_0162 [Bacteroides sp. 2_1_33B]KDS37610.1 hypothetical protein M091_0812 [Parabacteroides distasonis str. 3776 D15 i]KDS49774.1 hypothetical protein M090_2833 [Parabacteroides distasonis str. 3776 Po2 i]KDS69831.1 hypothetical protein M092_3017 [Parabacteroides distasonis str. 3776 D15 iv]
MPGCGSLYENHTPACMIFIQPFSVPLSPIKEIKENKRIGYGELRDNIGGR